MSSKERFEQSKHNYDMNKSHLSSHAAGSHTSCGHGGHNYNMHCDVCRPDVCFNKCPCYCRRPRQVCCYPVCQPCYPQPCYPRCEPCMPIFPPVLPPMCSCRPYLYDPVDSCTGPVCFPLY